VTVDVTKTYPKKELILQDFIDVEYIVLETTEEFLCQGVVQSVGEKFIIVKNALNDGDIFIFDRNGKGVKKINRRGQGGEEYVHISSIILDEDNCEMYVNDISSKKTVALDLEGKYKRTIKHKEDASYSAVYNYNGDNLICYDLFLGNGIDTAKNNKQPFVIISKKDGSITRTIQISFKKKISTWFFYNDAKTNMYYSVNTASHHPIIPYQGHWILSCPSSDIIYEYRPDDNRLRAFMKRVPSIQTINPEVFLFPSLLTDRYYFFQLSKKEYDFTTQSNPPIVTLVFDKQTNEIFECVLKNDDYLNKAIFEIIQAPLNNEIASWKKIEAHKLVDSYKKGELKDGTLKEIAATLDAEDNPVIMLIKHKKRLLSSHGFAGNRR